jgi:hypothetical protein
MRLTAGAVFRYGPADAAGFYARLFQRLRLLKQPFLCTPEGFNTRQAWPRAGMNFEGTIQHLFRPFFLFPRNRYKPGPFQNQPGFGTRSTFFAFAVKNSKTCNHFLIRGSRIAFRAKLLIRVEGAIPRRKLREGGKPLRHE